MAYYFQVTPIRIWTGSVCTEVFIGDFTAFLQEVQTSIFFRIFAASKRRRKNKLPASWMEIGVESKGNPGVVTRLLAEETPQGPGKMLQVIVQVEGYSPFNVPKKYFQGKNAEVAPTIPAQVLKRLEKRSLPTSASVYASLLASRRAAQNSRSGWFATPFL